jgi:hypothetical protein
MALFAQPEKFTDHLITIDKLHYQSDYNEVTKPMLSVFTPKRNLKFILGSGFVVLPLLKLFKIAQQDVSS